MIVILVLGEVTL